MKSLLLHVGADTTNLAVVGPVFADNRFEFIPIDNSFGLEARTYADVPSRNKTYSRTLADLLPSKIAAWHPHLDPDFQSCTYGEPDEAYIKQTALRRLVPNDLLFFVSSLAPYDSKVYETRDKRLRAHQRGRKNKYIIGVFTVSGVVKASASRQTGEQNRLAIEPISGRVTETVVRQNHHFLRLRANDKDEFIVVAGNRARSVLLPCAVRLTQRYERFTFRLNPLGKAVLKKETDPLRGVRRIDESGTKALARAIAQTNPNLGFNLLP